MSSKITGRVAAVLLVLLAPAACATAPGPAAGGSAAGPPIGVSSPSADPTPSAAPSPSPILPPSAGPASPSGPPAPERGSATPSRTAATAPRPAPARGTLPWYVAQVPTFPKAPRPRPVDVAPGGSAPLLFKVPTSQKVAFITIDDGELARPGMVPDFIRAARIPVTMFLNSPAATTYAGYFRRIEAAGGVVENHTVTHTSLRGKPYAFQRAEICGCADQLQRVYGKRPTLFRPPFGNRDATTLRAARDCGAKVVFHWRETVDKGIVRYQTTEKVVRPGDVLLLHFRPALMDDLLAALKAIHAAGLTPALLEDYVR